jgi:hypothetical protein
VIEMTDQQGLEPHVPIAAAPAPTTMALWTPKGIGVVSAVLGFPGAVVLAALNWRRMGRIRKAIVHLGAAVIATWALFLAAVSADVRSGGFLIGLGVGYYLYRAQRSDQAPYVALGRVTERSGLAGALIAIVASVLIFGSGVIAVAATNGGLAHRGEVLFATRVSPDACSPIGHASTFGPSDRIFLTAVMRETVQTGSRVVFEAEAAGETVGPFSVTTQPPYDCLGTSESIGPLDPGTYTVRYRYDGQPGTPDLAKGTFTITQSAGSSPVSTP